MPTPHLIVMLTHNDHTVANAREIYLQNTAKPNFGASKKNRCRAKK